MSNILDTIKAQLGDDVVDKISKQLGEGPGQVKSAIDNLLPSIMKGVSNKASGDASYLSKLDTDGDGDVDLDDLKGLLGGGAKGLSSKVSDLFGDKKEVVEKAVAEDAGITKESASSLMETLTGLVTKNISKQKAEGGAENVLANLQKEAANITSSGGGAMKKAMGFLDGDGDGKVDLNDLKNIGKSLFGKFGR